MSTQLSCQLYLRSRPAPTHCTGIPSHFLVKSNRKPLSSENRKAGCPNLLLLCWQFFEIDNFLNPGTQAHKNKTSTSACLIKLVSVQKNCRQGFQLNNYLSTLDYLLIRKPIPALRLLLRNTQTSQPVRKFTFCVISEHSAQACGRYRPSYR